MKTSKNRCSPILKKLSSFSLIGTVLLGGFMSGCSFAPPYHTPTANDIKDMPITFKEGGAWTSAQPADALPRGTWWRIFNDDRLNDLEDRIEKNSPELAESLAHYQRAQAYVKESRAGLFPSISIDSSITRQRVFRYPGSTHSPYIYNPAIAGGSISYEVDVWGRIRNMIKAGKAMAQASAADMGSVRLSLQAELADDYMRLRGLDAQAALYRETVAAYMRALQLTVARHDGGAVSGVDVERARMQLSSARAELSQVMSSRALMEHAIAALIGEQPSNFSIDPVDQINSPPVIPVSVPSQLLERRPDIASAERSMAAANAAIGSARAAFFPTISLSADGGSNSAASNLLSAPSGFWALGPAMGVLPLFQGGRRRARVKEARADFDAAAAAYRNTVLKAFQDVEDQLALANWLANAHTDQEYAVTAARRANNLATIRYKEGAANYLEVVIAQTAELQNRREAIVIQTQRLQAGVGLIRSFGGGWKSS
ncbi:MAG: efflux transporter outer membrane subunit [Zymomonas mobilis subsp. pomaceae]|uniref:RND efflux system, outer membrane lipoprotein, NodT family n=1 Tax=Zymomonas mobilis subsp. pomaceae (strain ATCC 29192 / DSM 22645 / JCM 10191 / CCUG 17912 / NBRC 13757 / NCIMB 11200 / NRRL B-4491 / Barker I) TaxID=579138 RepID=F8EVG6_ZYMMT|nr:efflux transporter outer membrane subunit [Zymomonas mobilis]AEI37373.1 RND efflux system, outer membrane lipoprotein, NodT family [Zymomonas mobilis subsp. pomaceae ATCC 29192]MDX5948741.1 efflux transporter outer membrane subunit [Zymomonas mobilis subsp. pomaceae]